MIQNDRGKAMSTIDRVLALDAGNPIALGYYTTLSPDKPKFAKTAPPSTAKTAKTAESSPFKPVGMREEKSSNFHITGIVAFVIGAVCASAVLYFLVFPAFRQEGAAEVASIQQEMTAMDQEHEQRLREITADNEELHRINNNLRNEIDNANQTAALQDRIILANQAHFLFLDNQFAEAIDILDNMDTSGLPFDVNNRIEAVFAGSYPRLATHYYSEGDAAYRAGDHHKALVDLERAFRFMDNGTNLTAAQQRRVLSVLGTLYANSELWEQAHAKLTLHLEMFPQHDVNAINNRLRDIEEHL